RERLNQIAGKKLAALAIPVRLGADRETLEGELAFAPGRVVHPATGAPIAKARFAVVGHDHLRFVDAPLSALPPIAFFEAEKGAQVEQKIALSLQKRGQLLQQIAGRMKNLKLAPAIDPD